MTDRENRQLQASSSEGGNQKPQLQAKPGSPNREQVPQASSQPKDCLTATPPTGRLGLKNIWQSAAAVTNNETGVAAFSEQRTAQKQTESLWLLADLEREGAELWDLVGFGGREDN